MILTAGHDVAALALPVRVDVTHEDDMNGPDRRTRITPDTRDVLFAAYAPAGVGENAVRDHLQDIRANVLLIAPEAETGLLATLQAEVG